MCVCHVLHIKSLSAAENVVKATFLDRFVILDSKADFAFLLIAARHGFSSGETLVGTGGPGEERTHGCGGGKSAVCVGGLHGEKNKHTTPNITKLLV